MIKMGQLFKARYSIMSYRLDVEADQWFKRLTYSKDSLGLKNKPINGHAKTPSPSSQRRYKHHECQTLEYHSALLFWGVAARVWAY